MMKNAKGFSARGLLPQNRPFRVLFGIVKVILLAFIVILVIQDCALFHPSHDPGSLAFLTARPEFEVVEFTANDRAYHGVLRRRPARNALWEAYGEASPLILFFYGNAQNAAGAMRSFESFRIWPHFLDFHCLIVDYTGYGPGRRGRPSARNIYADALAAFDFARKLPGISQIIVIGYSLGTAPAVYLAARRQVDGLVLLAPFANVYDLFNNVLPIFHGPLRLLVRHKFYSDRYAEAVTIPTLLIASRDDEIVPFASAERLNARFGGETSFVILSGVRHVRHNEILFHPAALESVRAYLSEITAMIAATTAAE